MSAVAKGGAAPGFCMPVLSSLRLIDGCGRPSRCRRKTPAVLPPVRHRRPGPPVGLDGGACILFEREGPGVFFLTFAARRPSWEVGGCLRDAGAGGAAVSPVTPGVGGVAFACAFDGLLLCMAGGRVALLALLSGLAIARTL